MVQLYDYDRIKYTGPKNWWKLDSGKQHGKKALLQIMNDKGYACKSKSKSLAHLRRLYVYCQRGLMSYEGLSRRELKLYATQRALPVTAGQDATLASLKAQLEQADDAATFRLCDLPPELRKIIFSHYFNSFIGSEMPILSCQPPIAYASRMARQESLPLFLERRAFKFNYVPASMAADFDSMEWMFRKLASMKPEPGSYALTSEARKFMAHTTAHNFALIRNFTICIDNLDLIVNLSNKDFVFEITTPWYFGEANKPVFQATRDRLSAAIDPLLKGIVARPGTQKLRTTDVDALCEVLQTFVH